MWDRPRGQLTTDYLIPIQVQFTLTHAEPITDMTNFISQQYSNGVSVGSGGGGRGGNDHNLIILQFQFTRFGCNNSIF